MFSRSLILLSLLLSNPVFAKRESKKKFTPLTGMEVGDHVLPPENAEGTKEWLTKYESDRSDATVGAPLSSIKSRFNASKDLKGDEHEKVKEACKDVTGDKELIRCLIKASHEILGKGRFCRHFSRVFKMSAKEFGHDCEIVTSKDGGHQWNKLTISGKVWLVDAHNNIFFPQD